MSTNYGSVGLTEARVRIITEGAEQAAQQMGTAARAIGDMGDYAARAKKSMQLFSAALVGMRVGAAMENAGRAMLDFAKNSATAAMEWETGMRKIRTQTDLGEKAFGRLNSRVLDIAGELPFALDDVQQSLYDIYSGTNFVGRQGVRLMEMTAKAAVAGGAEIASATDAVIGAVNGFKLGIKDVPRLLDLQFQLVRNAKGDYQDYADALNNVYPSAQKFGQSLETTFAAISFASKGGSSSPSQAIISVARAMDQLGRAKNAAALEEFGVAVYDAAGQTRPMIDIIEDLSREMDGLTDKERQQALYDIFGVGGIQAGRFLNMAIPGIARLREEFEKFGSTADGAMKRAFRIMIEQNPEKALEILQNRFQTLRIEIASRFFWAINDVVKMFDRLLDAFDRLSPSMQDLFAKVTLLGGAFLLFGGRLITVAANLAGMRSMMILADQTAGVLFKVLSGQIGLLVLMAAKFAAIGGAIYGAYRAVQFLIDAWSDLESVIPLVTLALSTLAAVLLSVAVPALISMLHAAVSISLLLVGEFLIALKRGALAVKAFGISISLSLPWLALIAVGIELVVWALRAWSFAQKEHQNSVKASINLQNSYVEAVKTGRFTVEEAAGRIKQTLGDETLSWDERNETVARSLHALNEWTRAGGKAIEGTHASVAAVRKQIAVNKSLGQSTEDLEKNLIVFAGMTMETFEKWKTDVSGSFDLVANAIGNIGDEAKITTDKVLNQLDRQIRAARNFLSNVRKGATMGLTEPVLMELLSMGTTGMVILDKFIKDGGGKLDDLAEKMGLAGRLGGNALVEAAVDALQQTQNEVDRTSEKVDKLRKLVANFPSFDIKPNLNLGEATRQLYAWLAEMARQRVILNVAANPNMRGVPGQQTSHTGGFIGGVGDIPSLLQSGEFVIRRSQARRFAPILAAINTGNDDMIARVMKAMTYNAAFGTRRMHEGGRVDEQAFSATRPTYTGAPGSSEGLSSQSINIEQHFYDSRVNAQEAINELDWLKRTSPWTTV